MCPAAKKKKGNPKGNKKKEENSEELQPSTSTADTLPPCVAKAAADISGV